MASTISAGMVTGDSVSDSIGGASDSENFAIEENEDDLWGASGERESLWREREEGESEGERKPKLDLEGERGTSGFCL